MLNIAAPPIGLYIDWWSPFGSFGETKEQKENYRKNWIAFDCSGKIHPNDDMFVNIFRTIMVFTQRKYS